MTPDPTPGARTSDQPGIVYTFKREDDGEEQIRKLVKSGHGHPGPSPGDVAALESTKSNPETQLPKGEIPGRRGHQQPDCGEDQPHYACQSCGTPIHVGRTCKSPLCKRCWAANVFERTVKIAGQQEALKMYKHSEGDSGTLVRQHWSATAPTGFAVDSEQPIERGKEIIKELFRRNFGIENLQVHYHPWGLDQDQEVAWADVIDDRENWKEKVVYRPHFHVLFVGYADKSATEAIHKESGWILNRHEREIEGKMISVEDLEDLTRQVMYNLTHSYVEEKEYGHQIWARQLGQTLHNEISYIPDKVRKKVEKYARKHAPKLMGVQFADVANSTCSETVTDPTAAAESEPVPADGGWRRQTADAYTDDLGPTATTGVATGGGAGRLDLPDDQDELASSDSDIDYRGSSKTASGCDCNGSCDHSSDNSTDDEDDTEEEVCGGEIVRIEEAAELLNDEQWREQAEYDDALETAYQVWKRRVGSDEFEAPDHDGSVPPPDNGHHIV